MVKKKKGFNPYERVALTALVRARRKLTTKQVADMTQLSWITAKKHLLNLKKKRYLERKILANKIYWKVKK